MSIDVAGTWHSGNGTGCAASGEAPAGRRWGGKGREEEEAGKSLEGRQGEAAPRRGKPRPPKAPACDTRMTLRRARLGPEGFNVGFEGFDVGCLGFIISSPAVFSTWRLFTRKKP